MKRFYLLFLLLFAASVHTHADDWMARLADEAYVDQLSLPGAHDSATGEGFTGFLGSLAGNTYGRTQDLTISAQWEAGIRVFDLRPAVSGNTLKIFHGILETKASLQSALATIIAALTEHPTEFAVVLMRHESEADSDNANWATLVRQCLESDDIHPWLADFRRDLTVGDLRGKLLVLSRDTYGDAPIGGYVSGVSHEPDFASQCRATIRGISSSTTYCHQDYFDCSGEGGKQIKSNAIVTMLDYSTTQSVNHDRNHRWFCNNTSGYSKTANLFGNSLATSDGYRDNASVQNALVVDYLQEQPGVTGFVMMDFAGKDVSNNYNVMGESLIQALIENNFRYDMHVATSLPAQPALAAEETGRYNLLGQPVPPTYRGTVVIRHADGSTRKHTPATR